MAPRPKTGEIEGLGKDQISEGIWTFDERDFLVYAMLCDPIYCAELLVEDPNNHDYAGRYRVHDYQYPLNRPRDDNHYQIHATSRASGKSESIKNKVMAHCFKRKGEGLLLTAPQNIHILPLARGIERRIEDCRLTRDMLDTTKGKTGFTHRPFGVHFKDGTYVDGRLPQLSGVGVKGAHTVEIIVDEGQEYPEPGWIEIGPCLEHDHTDRFGNSDFAFHIYGVHSGSRDSGFYRRSMEGHYTLTNVTALQRPDWGPKRKQDAIADYGGTSSPDYRRNILGEAGSGSSAFFVLSRLLSCVDSDPESNYNKTEYVSQLIRVEDFDESGMSILETLDLPTGARMVHGGMDIGHTNSPTVITLFDRHTVKGKSRLVMIRRFVLERFRSRQVREALYAISRHYGRHLKTFGTDSTGGGTPIVQEMNDDPDAPKHLLEVHTGYGFNTKVPVGIASEFVSEDASGNYRDQYGSAVRKETDPLTGQVRWISMMPLIESSTRYLREWVDTGFLLLPMDNEVLKDFTAETQQRVKRIGGTANARKGDAFHTLDSCRVMAQAYHEKDLQEQLALPDQGDVLDAWV